jgi:hypothetical protein
VRMCGFNMYPGETHLNEAALPTVHPN